MSRLLNVKQVAERLSCHPQTVWKLLKKGSFPKPRRLGSMTRWLESDIDAFIDSLPADGLTDVVED